MAVVRTAVAAVVGRIQVAPGAQVVADIRIAKKVPTIMRLSF
jgi:hypothetical protein